MLPLLLLINFVVILSDDQRANSIGSEITKGAPAMQHVSELLSAKGMTFTNAFDVTPLCSPSRATLLTGLYSHNHGIRNNEAPLGGATLFNDSDTLATRLHSAGYMTGLVGKYMNDYDTLLASKPGYVPPGWDDWHAFVHPAYYDYQTNDDGLIHDHGSLPTDYSTDMVGAAAVKFIEGASGPFFLLVAPYGPHQPSIPAPRHKGHFTGLPQWRPPSYNEADVSDKPAWLRSISKLTPSQSAQVDQSLRDMLECGLSVDELVAHVVDALDARGVLRDTAIIYLSDNGYEHGEHRLIAKNAVYRDSSRVAMIVRYDAMVSPGVSAALTSNTDTYATILDLAGVSSAHNNGVSLRPILNGTVTSLRDSLLLEHWRDDPPFSPRKDPPDYQAVRTSDYLYATYSGDDELYALAGDPDELVNVASKHQRKVSELQAVLAGLEAQ